VAAVVMVAAVAVMPRSVAAATALAAVRQEDMAMPGADTPAGVTQRVDRWLLRAAEADSGGVKPGLTG